MKKIRTIFNQFKRNPIFTIKLFYFFLKKDFICNVNFFSEEDFIKNIKNGKSLIRLGDGDMGIMHNKNIFHQEYNKNLENDLRLIIKDYSDNSKYILMIPKFLNVKNSILKKKNILICWLPFKLEFIESFNKDMYYGDAHYFYYLNNAKIFFEEFIKNKNILFVTNNIIIEKLKKSYLLGKNIYFIETPIEGTYDVLEKIEKKIDYFCGQNKIDGIVFSCGCSSRILSYKFSKKGIQSFDVGTGINSYLDNKDYSNLI